jgi:hypothetical protein
MKLHIAFVGALAAAMLATPAVAARHSGHHYRHHARTCAKWRHGHCVRWTTPGYMRSTARHSYRVGYVFGPSYGYTAYTELPQPYVTRYHLSPDNRYVYSGNTVYVVDPTTYAVTRILNAIPR